MTNCKAETNIYDALLSAKVNITITQPLLNPGRRNIISIEATKLQSPNSNDIFILLTTIYLSFWYTNCFREEALCICCILCII